MGKRGACFVAVVFKYNDMSDAGIAFEFAISGQIGVQDGFNIAEREICDSPVVVRGIDDDLVDSEAIDVRLKEVAGFVGDEVFREGWEFIFDDACLPWEAGVILRMRSEDFPVGHVLVSWAERACGIERRELDE